MGNLKRSYILICLLLLLIFHIIFHLYTPPAQPNTKLFSEIGENLVKHGMYSFDGSTQTRSIQPLYTLFFTFFYHILKLGYRGVVIMQIILDLLAFLIILKTAEHIFGRSIPRLLPLILIGHVAIWMFGLLLINECLYIFITVCGMYFLVRAIKLDQTRDFILAGAMAGLALLTRPVGLGFIAAMIAPILLFWKRLNRPLLKMIITGLAVVVVILPWTIRNSIALGKTTPLSSEDSYHLLYASLPDSITSNNKHMIFDPIETEPDHVADSANIYAQALKNIFADPLGFMIRGIKKIFMVWFNFPGTREWGASFLKLLSKFVQYGILLLAIIGFFGVQKKYAVTLLLPAVFYSLILFFTYATTRFTIPALPFLLILTAQGVESLLLKAEK